MKLIGKSLPGGTKFDLAADTKRVGRYALPVAANVVKLSVYVDGLGSGTGDQVIRGVIYSTAGTLLAQGDEVLIRDGQPGSWVDLPFLGYPGGVALAVGSYDFGVIGGANANSIRVCADWGAGAHTWATPTPVLPSAIPNLKYWYAADAIAPVADGTALAAWNDSSGNGFNLSQATAGSQPKYYAGVIGGKPVVRFDAAAPNFMDSTCPADQKPFTFVAVVKRGAGGTTAVTIVGSSADGGAEIDFLLATDQLRLNKENLSNIFVTGGTVLAGATVLVAVTYDGAGTWATYLNGVTSKSDVLVANTAFTAGTTVRVGRGGALAAFDGDMAELMRFERVLSFVEMQGLFAGLANKYSLALTARTPVSPRRAVARMRGTNLEPELADYSPVGANMNPNGSFETDIAGVAASGAGVHTLTRDLTEHQFGIASLKTVVDGTASGQGPGYNVGNSIDVVAGGTYTFSVYLKGTGSVALGVSEYLPAGGAFVTNQYTGAVAMTSGAWTRRTFTFTVGGTTGRVILRAQTLSAQAITFWSDGVQLEAGAVATPYVDYYFANPWDGFWTHWNWAGWIKPNIDLAKAAGLNCIRIIGSIGAVTGYGLSQATYLARLQQVIEYCRDNGMYYYACGGDLRDVTGATLPGDATTLLTAVASLLKNYPDTVVGFDVLQEISNGYPLYTEPTVIAWATAWTAAIRAVAPNLPLTYSGVGANASPLAFADSTRFAEWDALLDYYDFHAYGTFDASAPNAFFMLSDRDMMLGEVGADRSVLSSAQITAQYNAVRAWMNAYPIGGALQWSVRSPSVSNRFGLYDSAGVLNADVSVPFLAFPISPAGREGGWNTDTYADGASNPFGVARPPDYDLSIFGTYTTPWATPTRPVDEIARLPWSAAQKTLAGGAAPPAPGSLGWYGNAFNDDAEGSFVLVQDGGKFAAMVGERLEISLGARTVYAYCKGTAVLNGDEDLAVPRRVYSALSLPTTVPVPVEVSVVE